MKFLIWVGTAVVALLWTLLIAVTASLTTWLVGSADQVVGGGLQVISQWPVPEWLALWVDPALLEPIKAMVASGMEMLATATPWLTPMLTWVASLLWVIWAIVMAILLAIAVGAHLLVGKLRPASNAGLAH